MAVLSKSADRDSGPVRENIMSVMRLLDQAVQLAAEQQ